MVDPSSCVGQRVSLRYLLAEPQRRATDVIGRLVEADGDRLIVTDRDGLDVTVPRRAVIALRVVPGRPRRSRPAARASADDLTRIASRGWPPLESVALGEWELRAARAFTGRANSAAVHGDPGRPLKDALQQVVDFYATRGLAPQAQVVHGSDWDHRFVSAGWRPRTDYRGGALVQTTDLTESPTPDPRVTLEPAASAEWMSLYGRVGDLDDARAVLEGPRLVGFARLSEPVTGIARVVVTGEWAGLAAVEVEPAHRRQGHARALVNTCLAWAIERGATRAYLQTMASNTAALALYEPYGFVTHHAYRYLVPA